MTLMLTGTWSHSSARTQLRISSVITSASIILFPALSPGTPSVSPPPHAGSFPPRLLDVWPHAEQLHGIEIAMACWAPRQIGTGLLRVFLHHPPVTCDAQAVHGVQVPGGDSLLRPLLRVDDGFLQRHLRISLGTGRRGGSILHLVRVPVAADAPLVAAEFHHVGSVAEDIRGVVHVAVALVTRRVPVEGQVLVMALDAGWKPSELRDVEIVREEDQPIVAVAVDHQQRHALPPVGNGYVFLQHAHVAKVSAGGRPDDAVQRALSRDGGMHGPVGAQLIA